MGIRAGTQSKRAYANTAVPLYAASTDSGTSGTLNTCAVEIAARTSFIDICNPGAFPNAIVPEQFITQPLKPLHGDSLVTRVWYYSKDLESSATGLKRILDSCSKADIKMELQLQREEYGFAVRFHRHCGKGWKQGNARSAIQGAPGTPNGVGCHQGAPGTPNGVTGANPGAPGTPNGVTGANLDAPGTLDGVPESKSDVKAELQKLLIENPKTTRKRIATFLGMSVRTVQRVLNGMEDVRFIGGGRNGHWAVTGHESRTATEAPRRPARR